MLPIMGLIDNRQWSKDAKAGANSFEQDGLPPVLDEHDLGRGAVEMDRMRCRSLLRFELLV